MKRRRKPELNFAALKVLRRRRGRNGPILQLLEQLNANQRYRRKWRDNWTQRPG